MREPAREYQFFRISNKPFLSKFINQIGVQSIEALQAFIMSHPLGQKLHVKEGRIDINDLYTILIYEVLREKNIQMPRLGNAIADELRNFLYCKSVQELNDLGLFDFVSYVNSIEPVAVNSQF